MSDILFETLIRNMVEISPYYWTGVKTRDLYDLMRNLIWSLVKFVVSALNDNRSEQHEVEQTDFPIDLIPKQISDQAKPPIVYACHDEE